MKPPPAALVAFLALPLPTTAQAADLPCTVLSVDLPAGVDILGPALAQELVKRLGIVPPEPVTAITAMVVGDEALVVIATAHTCGGVRIPRQDYERVRRALAGTGA